MNVATCTYEIFTCVKNLLLFVPVASSGKHSYRIAGNFRKEKFSEIKL